MTYQEFEHDLLPAHCARFTGCAEKFGAMDVEMRTATKKAWWGALRNTELDAAQQASDQMFGNAELRPRSFDEHPSRLRRLASAATKDKRDAEENARAFASGQRAYNCAYCRDQGTVSVKASCDRRYVEAYGEKASRMGLSILCRCRGGKFDPEVHEMMRPLEDETPLPKAESRRLVSELLENIGKKSEVPPPKEPFDTLIVRMADAMKLLDEWGGSMDEALFDQRVEQEVGNGLIASGLVTVFGGKVSLTERGRRGG